MSNQTKNNNLNYLIDPTFTNVNRLFVLTFENEYDRTSFSEYYLPKVEIEEFNMLIDGKPFFEIPVKNREEAYEAIIEISKNNNYTTGALLDYEYFKDHYKLIAIDLRKQIELENPDLKQQINFIGRLEDNNATMFFIIEIREETTFGFSTKFCSCCLTRIKMETQKIVNLLKDSEKLNSKFSTRKWYIINGQNNGQCGRGDDNDSTIKFEAKVIKPNLCDYSDAYILVTGDIKVAAVAADTNVAFKNCAPFTRCVTHINDEHVETAENLDITIPMYNLIEYSDNYVDSYGSLYQFKRDESPMNDAGNPNNVALDNLTSFKYKASYLGKATDADGNDRLLKNAKIVVPLKYLSNFFRSLEMPLINCKIHLELNWNDNCVMYGADTYAGGDNANDRETTFQITSTKLYIPVVTLSTKGNENL